MQRSDMESASFQQALGHLETAIARLERVAQAPRPDARLAALEARHARLREGAGAAIERLDQLIGTTPPTIKG